MKQIFAFLIAILVFASCKTNLVYLTVTEPAPVSLPGYMKNIGIINRSLPPDENKVRNIIDDVLSEKTPDLDKQGSRESIRGVTDALLQNYRFSSIVFLDKVDMRNNSQTTFPSPLSWDVVDKICKENNVDAIFALEMFDTQSNVSYSTNPTTVNTPLGGIPAVLTNATMVTNVKTGWRIYDPQNRLILDEFPISQSATLNGSGINPLAAAAAIMDRKEAVKQTAYKVGQSYAYRILPYKIRVNREYYVKGTPNFRMAKRMARTGNWDGAAELWKREVASPSFKMQARANYDMGIYSEINGNLDLAIQYVQKAYEIRGKRLALYYLNTLKGRRYENNRLLNQAEEAK